MPPRKIYDENGERMATPFLKWAGGKGQLLPELTARLPAKFGTYHEPFVGSGALFFALKAQGRVKKARLSDINPELINCWLMIQGSVQGVISELEVLQERLTEEDFYAIRAWDPATLTGPQRAARLIYLNKTCFNGLYRENSKGIFNTPFGRYEKPRVLNRDLLIRASRALEDVVIEQAPFSAAVRHVKPGDFVYFDPPYHPVSTSASFTAYSRGGFGEPGQRQLATVFGALAEQGVHVMLSNSDVPLTCELYEGKGWDVSRVAAKRAINSKADKRGAVSELIVRAGGKAPEARSEEDPGKQQLRIAF